MQKGAAQEVQICPGRYIICITGFKTDIFAQVPKCGNVPYQKCEEGYEDKCKETPKKVKTFCVIFSIMTFVLYDDLDPPDWRESDKASMRVAAENSP